MSGIKKNWSRQIDRQRQLYDSQTSFRNENDPEIQQMSLTYQQFPNSSSNSGRRRVYKVNLGEDDINVSISEEISDADEAITDVSSDSGGIESDNGVQ